MDEILGRLDGRGVHHFKTARNDPVGNDPGNAIAALLATVKAKQKRARRFRLSQNAHRDFGNDAKQPFGPGNHPQKVIARLIQSLAPDPKDFTLDRDHFNTKDIVGG